MTRQVRIRDLSRAQREQLQRGDPEFADLAKEIVAEEFRMAHRPDRAEWYDVVDEDTGTKGEVKSTADRIGDKYPADGRFRIRRDQTRSLIASDAQGTAWYYFVLLHEGSFWIQRRRPSTVLAIINERGGWNDAGHAEFEKQHKLPFDEVFDL